MPKKLMKISGTDWMKGITHQTKYALGGLFRSATNFNPLYMLGFLYPSFAPTDYTGGIVTKTIKWLTGIDISGPFLIGYADGGTGTTFYKIDGTNGTVTDQFATMNNTGTGAHGLLLAKNRLLYADAGQVRSVSLTLTGDTPVLQSLTSGDHPMVMGADLNIYGIDGGATANNIFKIVSATSTAGNTTSVFALEPGMYVRAVKNDGRNLVMIADNRQTTSSGIGSYNCCVAYWNYTDGTLVQRYDFTDSAMLALEIQDDGSALIFGGNNIYISNVATFPAPIHSFKDFSTITSKPSGPAQVIKKNGSILWGDSAGTAIYGYGSLVAGGKKVFFQPYTATAGNITALTENAGQVWAGTSTPKLYGFFTGALDTAVLTTAGVQFDKPHKLTHIKVVSRLQLVSGDTISIKIIRHGGITILSDTQSFTYAADGAKQVRIFEIKGNGSSVWSPIFQDIDQIIITSNTGVQAVELWGDEVAWNDQTI